MTQVRVHAFDSVVGTLEHVELVMLHPMDPLQSNRVTVLVVVGRELVDPEPHQLNVCGRVDLLLVCVCQSLEDAQDT